MNEITFYEEEKEEEKEAILGVVLNTFDFSKFKVSFLQTDFKTGEGVLCVQKKFLFINPTLFLKRTYKSHALNILLCGFINTQCHICGKSQFLYELRSYPGRCPNCELMYYTSHLSGYKDNEDIGQIYFTYNEFLPDSKYDVLENLKQYFKFSHGFLNINNIVRLYNSVTKYSKLTVEEYCNTYIQPIIEETGYSIQSIPLNIQYYMTNKESTKETLLYRKVMK